ncbi:MULTISPECIES: hypothetical protein [Clostridium]|mgnify:CR=1 FL=1|jgi:hypothetical protein|uniref:Uncharacterized protein n=3 Tax=Clostridium TaxID=1485 RepID=A0A0B5QGP8_CLOBE|nr:MULTISPECIES: hypothetical protein [Clostridium]ABR36580.1 hypothetical protein Cbei_4471 [Clostridium beijerinckii NCIMB 8052]AIU05190.1 hypothetical protein Cbs_4471 [Clostridium beijerinckii ATCC 35702]AJH01535.1 hypothetical protein LF65_05006 [Clostridium beijerinckii]ALB44373.1 hypothetical protein X276_03315 [Clostridium beijerinckii NRRL B-598]AQS07330.1 hypothetical protein CLBIJ_47800 [Clostridium beijerinckii]
MLDFKKEIMNGSFNKVSKADKEAGSINVNFKSKDRSVDIKVSGKGLLLAGFIAVAPTAICVLGTTVTACLVANKIYKRRKKLEEI